LRARELAKNYLNFLIKMDAKPNDELLLNGWIKENISEKWSLLDELRYGIAFHDASLQRHISSSIIDYFNQRKLNCIFCTTTIIEGVNTSAKNVVFFDGKKGRNYIDYFDYNNIKGRSGRLMEHYVGSVYNFIKPPLKEEIIIDIPFFEQDPEVIVDEILVNIPKDDVKERLKDHYEQLNNSIEPDLLEIIKRNGTFIKGQVDIYYQLKKDLKNQYHNISWTQLPTNDNIKYILNLAVDNLFTFGKNIYTLQDLVFKIEKYRNTKNMMSIVENMYEYSLKRNFTDKGVKITSDDEAIYYDKAIEAAFGVYRYWFQYTVPKAFRVIDSIQRYLCEKNNLDAGSYSYFVQQLENDFVQPNLTILIEYGVPSSMLNKLERYVSKDMDEDEVLSHIKEYKHLLEREVLPYELEKLNRLF
jgi:hypothetical protein